MAQVSLHALFLRRSRADPAERWRRHLRAARGRLPSPQRAFAAPSSPSGSFRMPCAAARGVPRRSAPRSSRLRRDGAAPQTPPDGSPPWPRTPFAAAPFGRAAGRAARPAAAPLRKRRPRTATGRLGESETPGAWRA
eukprot:362836-Chlamydomonas_euryale.AAC.20